MVYPNALAANFCYWMLNVSEQKLSNPQKVIVQSVYNSAVSAQSVSTQAWHNYNLFTAWRFKFYDEWQNQQPSKPLAATNIYLNNWLAASYSAGNPAPSLSVLNRLNFALDYGQRNNICQLMDLLMIFNIDNPAASLIPLIGFSDYSITPHGSLIWDSSLGAKSDGTSFLSTDYFPNASHNNWNLNNSGFGYLAETNSVSFMSPLGSWDNASGYIAYSVPHYSGTQGEHRFGLGPSLFPQCYSSATSFDLLRPSSSVWNLHPGSSFYFPSNTGISSGSSYSFNLFSINQFGTSNYNYTDFVKCIWLGSGSIDPLALATFKALLTNVN